MVRGETRTAYPEAADGVHSDDVRAGKKMGDEGCDMAGRMRAVQASGKDSSRYQDPCLAMPDDKTVCNCPSGEIRGLVGVQLVQEEDGQGRQQKGVVVAEPYCGMADGHDDGRNEEGKDACKYPRFGGGEMYQEGFRRVHRSV